MSKFASFCCKLLRIRKQMKQWFIINFNLDNTTELKKNIATMFRKLENPWEKYARMRGVINYLNRSSA